MLRPAKSVADEELNKFLEVIMETLVKNNPKLALDKTLMNEVISQTKALVNNKFSQNNTQMTLGKLLDPEFIGRLIFTMVTGREMTDPNGLKNQLKQILDPLMKNPDFMKEFKKLLDPNNPENKNKNMGKELEKLLDKFLPDHAKSLKKQLGDFLDKLTKKVENDIKDPKSKLDASKEAPRPAPNDLYINLFGLLNSAVTGAYPVPVAQYMGNGLGFNDWSPYDGTANIDNINSIKNYQFGDPMGLEAKTIQNFESIPDTAMDSFTSALAEAGFNNSPKLSINH